MNAANTFGSFDLFGEGIKLSGTRKLDTVVRVSGYGNYLNRLQWEVYGVELIPSGLEDRIGRVPLTNGESPQVKYPADALTKISITF